MCGLQPHGKGDKNMPWRLILFIAVFAVFLVFVTFNLDNRCDISFGFKRFENVPVFITVFSSFVTGLVCSLPFALWAAGKRRRQKASKDKTQEPDAASPSKSNFSLREKFIREHGGKPSGGGTSGKKSN